KGAELITRRRALLQSEISRLDILSPLNILGRGYSITRKFPSLKVVRQASETSPDDRLEIILHQGKIIAKVEGRLDQGDSNQTERP
ncbi:MAG TPA: exodeoxyribonuclease VII large subunit, partial [Candidatus Manganitrophaceae bacterium]